MNDAPKPRDLNLSNVGKRTAYKIGFRDGVASVAPVRVKDLVEAAVAEERERCAKRAEDIADVLLLMNLPKSEQAARSISDAIRSATIEAAKEPGE